MKGRVLLAVSSAALLVVLAWASASCANIDNSAPVDTFIQRIMDLRTPLISGQGIIYRAAVRLFVILAAIQVTWSGVRLALRGEWGLSSIASVLVRDILFIGFFYWLLTQSANNNLVEMITGGLRSLAKNEGVPSTVAPAEFFFNCVHALYSLTDTAFKLGVYNSVWAAVPYGLTLAALSLASAFAVVYLLEYIVVVPIGVILMGMGGSVWSRRFAANYVRVLISVGIKLFCLQIIFGIANSTISEVRNVFSDPNTVASEGFFQHVFNFAGFSTIIYLSIRMIPQFAANLVAGASFEWWSWTESEAYGSLSYAGGGSSSGPGSSGVGESNRGSELYAITSSGQAPIGVMGTVSVNDSDGSGYTWSMSDSGEAASERERTRFNGAGFGNYAHDVIFDDDSSPGGFASSGGRGAPGAAAGHGDSYLSPGGAGVIGPGEQAASRPSGGSPVAPDPGDSLLPRGGTGVGGFDSGTPAFRGSIGADAHGAPDAKPSSLRPDVRSNAGLPGARGGVRLPDAGDSERLPGTMDNARPPGTRGDDVLLRAGGDELLAAGGDADLSDMSGDIGLADASENLELPRAGDGLGLPDARGGVRLPDARGNAGLPDARSGAGLPDARGNAGLPDARGGTGLPDARPASSPQTSADMRMAIRNSLMGDDGRTGKR